MSFAYDGGMVWDGKDRVTKTGYFFMRQQKDVWDMGLFDD
jgi:hypothetical protein